jgi:hypothetical protein
MNREEEELLRWGGSATLRLIRAAEGGPEPLAAEASKVGVEIATAATKKRVVRRNTILVDTLARIAYVAAVDAASGKGQTFEEYVEGLERDLEQRFEEPTE